MTTGLLPDEHVVKEGAANLQRGLETVGGRLFLTNQRLVFESHRFNIQAGATVIALADLRGARKSWTKFLGLIPLAPNAMTVATADGRHHCFTIWGRAAWIAELDRLTPARAA